jgi:hypothetical protein
VFRTPAPLANAGSLHGLPGAAHPPRGTIFAVTWALLSVANFLENAVHANFYEKALFVKADLAALVRGRAQQAGPFALCFYSHSRGAHILLVARCIG